MRSEYILEGYLRKTISSTKTRKYYFLQYVQSQILFSFRMFQQTSLKLQKNIFQKTISSEVYKL